VFVLDTAGCLDAGRNAGRREGSKDSLGFLFAACCFVCLSCFDSLSSFGTASCMVAKARMHVLARYGTRQFCPAAKPAR